MKKNKRDFSRCRSDSYQPIIMETPIAPEVLSDFSDDINHVNNFHTISYYENLEEIHEINERLIKCYWRLIETHLTKRQKEIIKLYSQDLTQTEIAKILGVNQSSITKSIHGNCDYKNGRKIYGGSEKKLRKAAEADPEIQLLKKKIQSLTNYL